MRTLKYILSAVSLLLLLAGTALSQTIHTWYYGPSATMTTNFTGPLAAYVHPDSCLGNVTGLSYVLLDARTAPVFRSNAPANIKATYDSLTNRTSLMRSKVFQIRGLSNNLVSEIHINLFDDRNGLAPADTCKCDHIVRTGVRGVWACATNERQSGRYIGFVWLGETAAIDIIANSPGGYWAWYETVIHEFSHTQFATEYDSSGVSIQNKWGHNGITISYGGDEGHWGSELQADQQSPLDEGLATFWGLEKNRVGRDSLVAWLNDTTARLILGSHSFLTGIPEMWNSPHRVLYTGTIPANRTITPPGWNPIRLVSPHIQTGAGYQLRAFKWLDVPGKYCFYNEQMFQAYALMFYEQSAVDPVKSFDMMLNAAKKLTPPNNRLRYPAAFANALANELETYARSAEGRTAQSRNTLVSSMLAYALYDIVTHFGMSEDDMKREFRINMETYKPIPKPKAYDEYWADRAALEKRLCPFLGGSDCNRGTGPINIIQAAQEARTYFRDARRILR